MHECHGRTYGNVLSIFVCVNGCTCTHVSVCTVASWTCSFPIFLYTANNVCECSVCRFSSYIGATNEWNKWEGLTYDSKRNVLYATVSSVGEGMLDSQIGSMANHIRVPANPCGCGMLPH